MKRKTVAILLVVGILLMVCGAAGAAGLVDTDKPVSLKLEYGYDGQHFAGQTIRVYRVATTDAYVQFTLTGAFANLPVEVNNVKTQEEWNQMASTLEAFVVAENIAPDAEAVTGEDGIAAFPTLAQGLYMIQGIRVDVEGGYCQFGSFMLAIPDLDDNDEWVYDVAAKPKSSFHEVKLEEITYSVSKLWKDEDGTHRPQSIEIDLYKDGVLQETVMLSEANNWFYSWTTVDDGAVWHAVEANVPDGYTVTLEQEGNHFTVINSLPGPPQTGDNSNIGLVFVVMMISGAGMIVLGIAGMRRNRA